MNSPVTIVLPVYNVERTLRRVVARILELTEIAARRLRVVVVDDGSTDGTYEAACELARQFPQINVLRQPFRRGIGPALEEVRRRLGAGQVVAHDGVTPIDVDELATLLTNSTEHDETVTGPTAKDASDQGRGSRRFAAVSTLHARMAEVHRAASFRWLQLDEPPAPRRKRPLPSPATNAASGLVPPLEMSATTFAGSVIMTAP